MKDNVGGFNVCHVQWADGHLGLHDGHTSAEHHNAVKGECFIRSGQYSLNSIIRSSLIRSKTLRTNGSQLDNKYSLNSIIGSSP
jgi:hypothetical protein